MADFPKPQLLMDAQIAAGAATTTSGPLRIGAGTTLPFYNVTHSGFGAGAVGTFQVSTDGVTWVAGSAPTLTAATQTTLSGIVSTVAGFRWVRFQVTNGGATGGRLVVTVSPRVEND